MGRTLLAMQDTPSIPFLPDPPWLEHYTLEQPWFTVVALLALGLIGFALLNRSGRGRAAMMVGAAGVVLGVGVAALAMLVTTTREQLLDRTREFVDMAATGQVDRVEAMLASDVTMDIVGDVTAPARARLLQIVREDLNGRWKVVEHRISRMRSTVDGEAVARTQMRVHVTPEVTKFPIGSWWIITWRKEAGPTDEWRVWSIQAQQIDGAGRGSVR